MKRLSIFMALGFVALSVTAYFFNPTEASYPEDEWPAPIQAR